MIRRPDVEVFFTDGVLQLNIGEDELRMLVGIALQKMTIGTAETQGEIEFVIFSPDVSTCIRDHVQYQRMKTIPWPVWAKVDDYGSPEFLSGELGYPTQARYTLTLLLPEEY